ncbi:MAG: SRPBCC family protein, partial [Solirubrobacteraceae bacterium]|nr:SRPBCC family protein [Solirubrobacteraceae bacterium]
PNPAAVTGPLLGLRLPYSAWWAMLAGALAGVLLRFVFSAPPGKAFSAMSMHFIYLAPIVVAMVTVYLAERSARRSWGYYAVAGAAANVMFVLGTLLILIEGLICAVLIVPLFMLQGALAGLVMGAVCRWTNWPRRAVYGVGALPILLAGVLPPAAPHAPVIGSVERTIVIAATPQQVWPQLLDARAIRADEVGSAWMYRIGVPLPESGVTRVVGASLVREVRMGKSIRFEQVATDWREHAHVRWTYRFAADSFPPGALDDHVTIGGRYFDVLDTTYTLTPLATGATELRVRFRYRVSTDFDWYAEPIARGLIADFEEVILGFYRQRVLASNG